jgi:hypothetical protein
MTSPSRRIVGFVGRAKRAPKVVVDPQPTGLGAISTSRGHVEGG